MRIEIALRGSSTHAGAKAAIGVSLFLFLAAFAACAAPEQASEQERSVIGGGHTVVDSVPTCTGCSIQLTPLVSLGRETDSVLLTRTPLLSRDSKGRTIAAVPDHGYQPVVVYRADGSIEGTLGRQGSGPGEHTRVEAIAVTAGDSVVLAHSYRRFSVFTSDGRWVRGGVLPTPPIAMIPLADGGLIINGTLRTEQTFGLPLHRLSADGALLRSFGTQNVFPPEGPPVRTLSPRLEGTTFWLSERSQYRLERVDTTGRTSSVITISTPWWFAFSSHAEVQAFIDSSRRPDEMEPSNERRPSRLRLRPPFGIASLVPDSAGRLWVAHHTHVEDWASLKAEYDQSTSEVRIADEMKGRMYRTVLDVIDPERGTLLARRIIPGYGWVANDGTYIQMQYRANGVVAIDISTLRLQESLQSERPQ